MNSNYGLSPELLGASDFVGNRLDSLARPRSHDTTHTASWCDDALHQLSQPFDSISELFASLLEIFRGIGCEYCAIHIRFPRIVGGFPSDVFLSSYPAEWQNLYQERGYEKSDPVAAEAFRTLRPVAWSNALFCENQPFWQAAESHSVRHQWALAMHGNHCEMGFICLASATRTNSSDIVEDEEDLILVSRAAHEAATNLLLFPAEHAAKKKLTQREREVLRWSAAGKTSCEIAAILGITERTVAFHVTEVMQRLNATNKTHAVAKALLMGHLI